MNPELVSLGVTAATVYLSLGLLFALVFVFVGAHRIDPAARDGGLGFRLLLLPGTAALWPWLALRWLRGTPPPTEQTAHRRTDS